MWSNPISLSSWNDEPIDNTKGIMSTLMEGIGMHGGRSTENGPSKLVLRVPVPERLMVCSSVTT